MLQEARNSSKNSNPFVIFSIWSIEFIYRRIIKQLRAKHNSKKKRMIVCSFYPSCSEYGILALKKYGFIKGWLMTIKRILKCTKYQHEESCIDYP